MNELVIKVASASGKQLTFADGTLACHFGIAPAGFSNSVMGDTFIRSAYVVYDLANNELSIAQTNFNATGTNIVEIGTGTTAVPDATVVENAVTAVTGKKGSSRAGTASLSTARSKAGAQRTAPSMNLGAMAIVGAGMFLIAI